MPQPARYRPDFGLRLRSGQPPDCLYCGEALAVDSGEESVYSHASLPVDMHLMCPNEGQRFRVLGLDIQKLS